MLQLNKSCFIFLFFSVSYFGLRLIPVNFSGLKKESYFEILCRENDKVFQKNVSSYNCKNGECRLMLSDNTPTRVLGSCNLKE